MRHSLPPHGASYYDTRENEPPDICCACDEDPDICGNNPESCEQAAAEEAADIAFEASREGFE